MNKIVKVYFYEVCLELIAMDVIGSHVLFPDSNPETMMDQNSRWEGKTSPKKKKRKKKGKR